MRKKSIIILLHVLACIGFLAIPVLFSPDLTKPAELFKIPPFQRDFLSYIFLIGFFYFNFFILIPKLYFNKRYVLFALSVLASFILMQVLANLLVGHHRPVYLDNDHIADIYRRHGRFHPPPFHDYANELFQFLAVLIFSLLLKISDRWKQVEREKLTAELSYLKAQINPHFLFNTLNSIYSLAIQRSDATADAVVKLSEMMRYVTTEAHSEFVSLEKELNYVSNYIELQKLRLGSTVNVNYSIAGDLRGKKITPLILIPFVENAFKYGVNPEEPSVIIVSILVRDDELTLHVINKKVHIEYSKEFKSGHGIENTRHRLEFCYPGKHKLEIKDEHSEYSVFLTISL